MMDAEAEFLYGVLAAYRRRAHQRFGNRLPVSDRITELMVEIIQADVAGCPEDTHMGRTARAALAAMVCLRLEKGQSNDV